MRIGRVRRRRSTAQRGLLLVVAALAFLVSGAAAGLVGHVIAATDAGIRAEIAQAPASDTAYEVTARTRPGAGRADAAVREHVAASLPEGGYRLHRSAISGPRTLQPPDAEQAESTNHDGGARIVLGAYPDLAEHAELLAGRWPDGARRVGVYPVAVHAGGAAELGLGIGDQFSIFYRGEPVVFAVTGLWVPSDPGAAYWAGTPLESGGITDHLGALVVGREADLAALPGFQLTSRWRLDLTVDRLAATEASAISDALSRLPAALAADSRLAGTQVEARGSLITALEAGHERVQQARAVVAVSLALLGVATVLAVGLVAHLLAVVREPETAVLRTRGAARVTVAGWAMREAMLVTIGPGTLGVGAAWMVLAVTGADPSAAPYAPLVGGGAAVLLVAATLTVMAYPTARTAPSATGLHPAGARWPVSTRARVVIGAGSAVASAAIAAAAVWWLRRPGTPFLAVVDGSPRVDPLAVILPALILLASGSFGAVAVPALARAGQRLAARQRGLTGPLAVRQVARRPMPHALPIVLLGIATGTATLAAGFAATWSDLQERTATQLAGTDLRVVEADRPSVSYAGGVLDLRLYRTVSGVARVTPVLGRPPQGSGDAIELVARPSGGAAAVPGVELPAGIRSVSVGLTTVASATPVDGMDPAAGIEAEDLDEPPPAHAQLQLWLVDGDGQLVAAPTEEIAIPAATSGTEPQASDLATTAALPAGGPYRLAGLDVTVGVADDQLAGAWSYDLDIQISTIRDAATEATADPGLALGAGWSSRALRAADGGRTAIEALPRGFGVRIGALDHSWTDPLTTRLLPVDGSADAGPPEELPVTATRAALNSRGLAVGDETVLAWGGGELPVRIRGVADVVPGAATDQVMVADLAQLNAMLLASGRPVAIANQIWVDLAPSAASDAVATAVAHRSGPAATILDPIAIEDRLRSGGLAGPGMAALWLTAAAAVVLAGVGAAAGAAALAHRRRGEVAMLRAVGLSASQQSRFRRREQILVGLAAVAFGTGMGWFLTMELAGVLAGTATAAPYASLHPVTQLPLGPWAAFIGVAIAAAVAVAIAHGSWVRRQAHAGTSPQHQPWWQREIT